MANQDAPRFPEFIILRVIELDPQTQGPGMVWELTKGWPQAPAPWRETGKRTPDEITDCFVGAIFGWVADPDLGQDEYYYQICGRPTPGGEFDREGYAIETTIPASRVYRVDRMQGKSAMEAYIQFEHRQRQRLALEGDVEEETSSPAPSATASSLEKRTYRHGRSQKEAERCGPGPLKRFFRARCGGG